jgi:hypothetical protein
LLDASTGKGLAGARVRLRCGADDPVFTRSDEDGDILRSTSR